MYAPTTNVGNLFQQALNTISNVVAHLDIQEANREGVTLLVSQTCGGAPPCFCTTVCTATWVQTFPSCTGHRLSLTGEAVRALAPPRQVHAYLSYSWRSSTSITPFREIRTSMKAQFNMYSLIFIRLCASPRSSSKPGPNGHPSSATTPFISC